MFDILYLEEEIREHFLKEIKNTNVSEIVIRDISPLVTELRFNLDIITSKYLTDDEKFALLHRSVIRRVLLQYGCETDIDFLTITTRDYIVDELDNMYVNDYNVNVRKLRIMILKTLEVIKLINTNYDKLGVYCVELCYEYDIKTIDKVSVIFNVLEDYLLIANFDKDKKNEVQLSYPSF